MVWASGEEDLGGSGGRAKKAHVSCVFSETTVREIQGKMALGTREMRS